ncbi:uncharacterized protein LOC108047180 [Drosophila rhopaloa]|uniref:C-type lectin domain-containing protein n=1 Tax=Drosophila rhopaloa TaxID=1041015 RepID=A0ABM5HN32_DRORH|nr:uncharacterized protein LOC108047180 [Drosophila rhopaloa]
MLKITTFILWLLVAQDLYGSPAESQENSRSVCLLKDAPNQCGSFCLSALGPLYDHMAKFKLVLNAKLESQQKSFDARLERIQNTLMSVVNKLEQGLVINTPSTNSLGQKDENSVRSVHPNLEKILERYFYIEENVMKNFTDAEDRCRQMGGHLASFQNEKELNAIVPKLLHNVHYFLGNNDRAKKGDLVSMASGKRSSFYKWHLNEPHSQNENENCVGIYSGLMAMLNCRYKKLFICQADENI